MLDFRGRIERGLQALDRDRPAEAEKEFRAALAMNPRDDQLLHLLGVSLVQQQRAVEALEPLQKAISLNRRAADYHNALGCALRDAGRYADALESFARALKLDARLEDVHYNIGQSYQRMGEFARAEEEFRALQARRPEDTELIGALSALRWQAGDREDAIRILREGIARLPSRGELRFLLADKLLALGRFEEGWTSYLWRTNRLEWLRSIGARDIVPARLAPSLEGRVVHVHGEQGLGDELFFLRFAPLLRARGASVHGLVTPRIAAMVERSAALDTVGRSSSFYPPGADHVLLGDLPFLLDAHRQAPPPALRCAPLAEKLVEVDALLAALPRPLVGLTWRAGTGPEAGNRHKLFKETSFDALCEVARDLPGSVLVLQRQPSTTEMERLRQMCGARLVDLSALNADLEAMLALLGRIDDYIGVSNTNMHLCAALSRSARVLVSNGAEFRWGAEGDHSPWFPGMTVYRQSANGDWREAIESLRNRLSI